MPTAHAHRYRPLPVQPLTVPIFLGLALLLSSCGMETDTVWKQLQLNHSSAFQDATQISAGSAHTCVVTGNGKVWCWGANGYGKLGNGETLDSAAPVGMETFSDWQQVTGGGRHTCGIRESGELWCWGISDMDALDGTIAHAPVQVYATTSWATADAGLDFTCGIRTDGTLWCWNVSQAHTPMQKDAATDWAQVSAGDTHACAIKTDGSLWCWGDNQFGQLGTGDLVTSTSPQPVGSVVPWRQVSASLEFTCGIKTDGTLWCWGINDKGQLGDGTYTDRAVPTRVGTDSDWHFLDSGNYFTCAIKTAGNMFCWGFNNRSQFGDGTTTSSTVPVPAALGIDDWLAVSAGGPRLRYFAHTCGIRKGGSVYCWGSNHEVQAGNATGATRYRPQLTDDIHDWYQVAGGRSHGCGITTGRALWCWGNNWGGQLGNGDVLIKGKPTLLEHSDVIQREITAATDWAYVSTGSLHTCALKVDDTLWCWGYNWWGQLGDETSKDQSTPTQEISGTADWSDVAAGQYHTCAVKTTGTLWCWGRNTYGQLGDGTFTNSFTHVQVGTDSDWAQVVTGRDHTCAIKRGVGGTLWCWGQGTAEFGGPGKGGGKGGGKGAPAGSNASNVPVQDASGASDWASVSAGFFHSCALKTDGTLWCWGTNFDGRLGNGTDVDSAVPVQEATGARDWETITVNGRHSCAMKKDHSLFCWGISSQGQTAQGDNRSRFVPGQEISGSREWQVIDTGHWFTVGIKADGSLWVWGDNEFGELGNGLAWIKFPMPVLLPKGRVVEPPHFGRG